MKPITTGVIIFIGSAISAILLYFFGQNLGITSTIAKIVVWACVSIVISLILLTPLITRFFWARSSDKYSGLKHLNPEDLSGDNGESSTLIGIAERWEQLRHIYLLTRQYKKHRKPWIFVVTQEPMLLDRVFPNIRPQLWVETASAIWIDAQAMEPANGWQYLRGIGKRPAEGIIELQGEFSVQENTTQLLELMKKLGWKLPINQVHFVNDANEMPSAVSHALKYGSTVSSAELMKELDQFANRLAAVGTRLIEADLEQTPIAKLSAKLPSQTQALADYIVAEKRGLGKLDTVAGISFIQSNQPEQSGDLIFRAFNDLSVLGSGKKLRFSKTEKIYLGLSAVALLVGGAFAVSAYSSYQEISRLKTDFESVQKVKSRAEKVATLIRLQQDITDLESRRSFSQYAVKFLGYEHRQELLAVAYRKYNNLAKDVISRPATVFFENKLDELVMLEGRIPDDFELQDSAYQDLKAYLMLTSHVEKTKSTKDAEFLVTKLTQMLTTQNVAEKDAQTLAQFFVSRMSQKNNLAEPEQTELVSRSRQVLVDWINRDQGSEQLYKRIIQGTNAKLQTITLDKLLNKDLKGIWNVGKPLPRIYTVEGWEKYIKPGLEQAIKDSKSNDWVLGGNVYQASVTEAAINSLKERYFKEYATAWYNMMNSITWQPRTTSLDAVNQLHVYADPQRSPLVALFNAVKENSQLDSKKVDVNPAVADAAKRVAARQLSTRSRKVADAVLNSQSENINALEDKVNDYLAGPLEAEFETLLQLIDAQINPKSDLSLQRYLERVTTVKQRLIQMTASSDTGGAARTAVQGVLNGGDNEFLDGIQYARLIEAGVGDRLLPFARNVFVLPFNSVWDSIAGVAQKDINNLWASNFVNPMQSELGGRYPFARSEIEVSIPVLAKYLDVNKGALNQFVTTQLAGVLTKQGNQWIVAPGSELKVNPGLLQQLNKLSAISEDFFVNGEGGYSFELKPTSTQGIVQYNLIIDGQSLDYFNQQTEWKTFKWPGDVSNAGLRISWETEAEGMRKTQEISGRFGFIRMLEKSRVTPIDSGTYLVEFPLEKDKLMRFYMRTNSGKGPLGLLELKNIHLPNKIFEVK
ncbi:ImcF-related family protein [uncultured Neisseria sp.]|jgi:imcF-related protein|uniref:ImcF-related family protein n=1 Tax=uncultured Neisseria sp. TaxID=237778 RepID=UPI0025E540D7|nr:ImcF-related family protein [uncultured Neisseria sp.]